MEKIQVYQKNSKYLKLEMVIDTEDKRLLGIINHHSIESLSNLYNDCSKDCGECHHFNYKEFADYDLCNSYITMSNFIQECNKIYNIEIK